MVADRHSDSFCINVLSERQERLSRRFARADEERFQGVPWSPGATRAPRLADALAWIECHLVAEHDAGDHTLAVGRVVSMATGAEEGPLLYFRGGYARLAASGS